MSEWYVVRTNPRCERRAADGLRAAGYEVHLPMGSRLIRRRHMQSRQRVSSPLLAGYCFVRVDAARQGFYTVRATDGVCSILGDYRPLRPGIVEEFQRLEAAGVFDELDHVANPRPFARGDRVEIVEGPMKGMVFQLGDYLGRHTARIVGAITMRIPLANLRKAA